jgi:hypothetical protein
VSASGHLSTGELVALIEQHTGRAGKKAGREIVLICPNHEGPDSTPSLNVREGDGGYPLIQCRSAGCTPEQVLNAIGKTWVDVFGDDSEHWTPSGNPWVAVYDYVDAAGGLVYQVTRTAEKEFAQRRPDVAKRSGYAWNLQGVERVPYRLPQVLDAVADGVPIWLADGEKDVHALERAGLVASCSSGGALKFPASFAGYFAGADVRVVVDQDPLTNSQGKPHAEGQRAALQIYRALAPVAKSVELLAPTQGKDAADHLAAGLSVDEFRPVPLADLEAIVAEIAEPPAASDSPPSSEVAKTEDPAERSPALRFLSGAEFRKQPLGATDPLIGTNGDALIMPHSLTLLAGIGGTGKTTLALHAAVHWAAGLPWFGITMNRPLRLILIENEGPHDPFAEKIDQLCDRFKECPCGGPKHGDLGAGFDRNATVLDAPWGKFSFDDMGLANDLNAHAKDFEADLVIANPLGRLGMRGAGTPEETRAFVNLLTNAGLFNDFAALLIHHMAKGKQTSLSQQISGDWGGHPDTILILEQAGQRRSKLTVEKNRWGDQGAREPIILNWLTEDDGPIGYRTAENPQGVADDTLYERIDLYLKQQEKPSGITTIRQNVPGQARRIKDLVERGVVDGRYLASGGVRPRYWLNEGAQGTQERLRVDIDG